MYFGLVWLGLAWSGPVRSWSGPGPARVRSGNKDIIVIVMIIISNIIAIMIINMLIINISNIKFIHGCIITGVNNNIYIVVIMAKPLW